MSDQNWEEVYKFAVLEVDGRKMPERISAARDAIRRRLQEMDRNSDHHQERDRLEHALNALKVLTTRVVGVAVGFAQAAGRKLAGIRSRWGALVTETRQFASRVYGESFTPKLPN